MIKNHLAPAGPVRLFVALLMTMGLVSLPAWSYAKDENKDLPPRAISVSPEYTGIVIPKGESASVDLNVVNGGRSNEEVLVTLPTIPKGWQASLKTYAFQVSGIYVPSDSSKTLTLKADPDKDLAPGKYVFPIQAQTQDGALRYSSSLTITVDEKGKEKKSEGVNINTSYPVLKGPTDGKFEFSVDVENKTDKEAIFNLGYEAPKDWEVNFKPSYEEKYFSSLSIKPNQSQSMAVQVKPTATAQPGEYPIKVKVGSENAKGEVTLQVVLTGTYKLDAGTEDGLLSLNASQGKTANRSFYVKNSGSAPQNGIKFLSVKPENWKVQFSPEKIDTLPPGEMKQVEMTITPAEDALVGDYSVAVNVQGEKDTKNLEFRTTVKASSAWGWVGIGMIIVVIGGLVSLFVKLGRH